MQTNLQGLVITRANRMWQHCVFGTNCMATQQIVATLAVVFRVRHYDQQ